MLVDGDQPTAPLMASLSERGYLLREETALPALGLNMLVLEIPERLDGPGAIRDVEATEPRSVAGVNHAFRTPTSDPSADPREYADAMLKWPKNGCVATMSVGIIDTAIDTGAAPLVGVDIVEKAFTSGPAADPRHGTDVAGIIAAQNRLTGVRLYSASVIDASSMAGEAAGVDAIVRAMNWLATNDVTVVNISLAGPDNKIFRRAVDEAVDEGMIIVAAVGNAGADAPPLYPAAYDKVLAVTAVDADAAVYSKAVRGDHVDLAAPGVDVFIENEERGRFSSGTSIAAPFVTARIAADPGLAINQGVEDVRRRITRDAVDLGAPGDDDVYGAGLVGPPRNCRTS